MGDGLFFVFFATRAEGEGFEPTGSLHPRLFSRQLQSTALPSLQNDASYSVCVGFARRNRTPYLHASPDVGVLDSKRSFIIGG